MVDMAELNIKEYVDSIEKSFVDKMQDKCIENIREMYNEEAIKNMSDDDIRQINMFNMTVMVFLMRIGAEVVSNEDVLMNLPDSLSTMITQQAMELGIKAEALPDIPDLEEVDI